jgi:hypothetical protein
LFRKKIIHISQTFDPYRHRIPVKYNVAIWHDISHHRLKFVFAI